MPDGLRSFPVTVTMHDQYLIVFESFFHPDQMAQVIVLNRNNGDGALHHDLVKILFYLLMFVFIHHYIILSFQTGQQLSCYFPIAEMSAQENTSLTHVAYVLQVFFTRH